IWVNRETHLNIGSGPFPDILDAQGVANLGRRVSRGQPVWTEPQLGHDVGWLPLWFRGRFSLNWCVQDQYPYPVAHPFSKPEVAIWPYRDALRTATSVGKRVFRNDPTRSNLANLVASLFGEPKIAIWPTRNVIRTAKSVGKRVFGNDPTGGNLANPVAI